MRANEQSATGLDALLHGWNTLRLAVEAPDRIPFWDVIVLTAAGSKQAELYERRVERVRARGLLPPDVRVVVIPDPEGRRIGSGGATLHALRFLRRETGIAPSSARILLVHAGGDSRRLPWAGVFGKVFVPVPILADPDSQAPSLFEHLLAVFSPCAARLPRGTLMTLTGDVLPLFSADELTAPENAALVLTRPVSLSLASRHGVIVPGRGGRVRRMLQKPTPDQVRRAGGLVHGAAALIDTGVYVFSGAVLDALSAAALSATDPVARLVEAGVECSLYEDVAGALVPENRRRLKCKLLHTFLLEYLEMFRLSYRELPRLRFLHFGTSAEVLDHLFDDWLGMRAEHVLSACGPGVAPGVIACNSDARRAGRVGAGSLLLDSRIGPRAEVGNRCIIAGADLAVGPWSLPPHTCLWQLPVRPRGGPRNAVATFCCGVDDNPKQDVNSGTFCNTGFRDWLRQRGVPDNEIWPEGCRKNLWEARLFPVHSARTGAHLVRWMLDADLAGRDALRTEWLETPRLSMADAHEAVDLARLLRRFESCRQRAVVGPLRTAVQRRQDRNVHALVRELPPARAARIATVLYSEAAAEGGHGLVPESRMFMVLADLAAARGMSDVAREQERNAFAAVHREVAEAVRKMQPEPVAGLPHGRRVQVSLPVRFDVAGGWSDTPPYCLERPAAVLNMALKLNGRRPVSVDVEALAEPVWDLTLADGGRRVRIESGLDAARLGDLDDPFLLLRTALVLTGYGNADGITQGVRVRTRAEVPRGSGLGTSSILGAALVMALQRLAGRPDDPETVAALVLGLEQMMTTGGGWQDQVGGLVPGVKLISSKPVKPLQLQVEPVPLLEDALQELKDRFVLAFSGQERLARNVLQIVVRKYLRRDAVLLRAVERLVRLAEQARDALALGDIDALGDVFAEVWMLHQQLDPHCSNPEVDALFRAVAPYARGFKLAGAGGGGFMGIIARDQRCAARIREMLADWGGGVRVYDWELDGGR